MTTRTFVRGALLACILALTTGTAAALTLDKTITIAVDDEQRTIHTFASSVAGALESAGLRVDDQDTLAPTASSAVEDGSRIVLRRGRPLDLTVDGTQHEIWTTALTVETALRQVGMPSRDVELSADPARRIPLEGMALVVRIAKPIVLFDGGLPAKEIHSTALSVGDLLTQQGVPLRALDTVTPERTSPVLPGMTVRVTRVTAEELSEKRLVRPPVRKVKDPEVRTLAKRVTVTAATVWDQLARCESGDNWAANSGNGYYGGLQFDKATWSANGGNQFAPYPHQASREQQIAVAQRVRNARGNYHAWPTCSAQLGLW
ncbi:MAG: transglycosylase family protein [Pseudonocardiales bacterium]|nr:transglycosylase family protein [Pseudonocardiales bacterium]MBV9029854.1 transglycosylase family protein [Pseudonocardiales bacterium]